VEPTAVWAAGPERFDLRDDGLNSRCDDGVYVSAMSDSGMPFTLRKRPQDLVGGARVT